MPTYFTRFDGGSLVRVRRRLMLGAIVAALVAVLLASCRDPTKITLVMSTDVSCADAHGAAIRAGSIGAVERSAPRTTTFQCDNGTIGTLVVSPESKNDASVAFTVTLAVRGDLSSCTPEQNYRGCIITRRELAYIPHTSLDLPMRLFANCIDVPCTEHTTCNALGRCVDARIEDPGACENGDCEPAGNDGGGDAPLTPDAPADAPVDSPADASDARDAADGKDSSPEPAGIFCGTAGFCTTNCCWSTSRNDGDKCDDTCDGTQSDLRCADVRDCTAGGGPKCCTNMVVGPGGTTWPSLCAYGGPFCDPMLCRSNADCVGPKPRCDFTMSGVSPPGGPFGLCAD
jgi:hypothetical protein